MSTAPDPAASARNRIAISFVALLVVWLLVLLVAGEVNVASIVLGAVLAAIIVWLGERRRKRDAPAA